MLASAVCAGAALVVFTLIVRVARGRSGWSRAGVTAIALVVTAQVPTIRTGLGYGAVGSKLAVVRAGVLVVRICVVALLAWVVDLAITALGGCANVR